MALIGKSIYELGMEVMARNTKHSISLGEDGKEEVHDVEEI